MPNNIKAVESLLKGDIFSLNQRKNAKLFQIKLIEKIEPPRFKSIPEGMEGKYLIVLEDCRQLILAGSIECFIHLT